MSIISAELTKISVNSYITMKISFTNQLRMIAERFQRTGKRIHTILDAIGSDSRIGPKYLKAGLSFGGPCFPRDNRLLAYTAKQSGVEAPLAEATDKVNQETNLELLKKVQAMAGPKRYHCRPPVLAYKPDISYTARSAGLFLAQQLKRHGYRVLVHDYGAKPNNAPTLHEFRSVRSPRCLEKQGGHKAGGDMLSHRPNVKNHFPKQLRCLRHGNCDQ